MRIVHVVPRWPPAIGGGEACCAALAAGQQALGHAVQALVLRGVAEDELWGPPDPRLRAVRVGRTDRDGGIRVRRCAVDRLGAVLQKGLARADLHTAAVGHSAELYGRLFAAARGADVVHAHAAPSPHLGAALLIARLARRPLAVTPFFHPGDAMHEQRPTLATLRRADVVFAATDAEREALVARGVPPARIIVAGVAAPPAADGRPVPDRSRVRAALGVGGDLPLLCVLGRKTPAKGLDVLFRALPRVRHRPAPVTALVGPRTRWFEETPRPVGLRILDVPPLPESAKRGVVAAADVLVSPSRSESFGLVFLEAWALGTPVVGADTAPVREVLGDDGARFRPDDPDDLAAVIDRLLADPAAARAAAARGAARTGRRQGWDDIAARVVRAYPCRGERRAAGGRQAGQLAW